MAVKRVKVKSVGPAGLERLELKRLTERIGWLFSLLQEAAAVQTPTIAGTWALTIDVCETTNAIEVRIELPGVTAAQVRVGLNGNKLRIWGDKKKRAARQRITSHLCSERTYGHFERVVPVRWPVEVKGATAELANGVLVVRLPKLKDRRGSEIAIPITEKDS
ncbi:MAG TPA: Hsp20/alpha crystallin family protein [Pyrinomonadaceae bacterium]|nr:Hsp20/alpha crystallin family protein [Pyrinomonadaceae bacterium]